MYSTDNTVSLPQRQTVKSAGYDFYMPFDLEMKAGVWYDIDTCICFDGEEKPYMLVATEPNGDAKKVYLQSWFMHLIPRSGLGNRAKFRLANTCGVIDQDYIGHTITAKVCSDVPLTLKKGDRFMQGIFIPVCYNIFEKPPTTERNGGHGSTDIPNEDVVSKPVSKISNDDMATIVCTVMDTLPAILKACAKANETDTPDFESILKSIKEMR